MEKKHDTAFVMSHFGLGDSITIIGAVRYLSTIYDKVIIVCREKFKSNVDKFYTDNPKIIVMPARRMSSISVNYGANPMRFKKITENKDVYLAGNMVTDGQKNSYDILPLNFYIDMKLNPEYYWTHFHIPVSKESRELYKSVSNHKYIFIHKEIHTGKLFTAQQVCDKFDINPDETIVIDAESNYYNEDHKYHEIAAKFVFKPLVCYIDTLINSDMIIVSDSCLFCLATQLKLKTDKCYYVSRKRQVNYEHLFNNRFKPDTEIRPKFTKIRF